MYFSEKYRPEMLKKLIISYRRMHIFDQYVRIVQFSHKTHNFEQLYKSPDRTVIIGFPIQIHHML